MKFKILFASKNIFVNLFLTQQSVTKRNLITHAQLKLFKINDMTREQRETKSDENCNCLLVTTREGEKTRENA